MTAVVEWKISSYWRDESRCVLLVGRLIWDFVSICKRNGLCQTRRGKRRVWPWDIVKMYVVLLTELRWRRNSTGWFADFPLGRERRFVARRVKTGGRSSPRVRRRELSSVFTYH